MGHAFSLREMECDQRVLWISRTVPGLRIRPGNDTPDRFESFSTVDKDELEKDTHGTRNIEQLDIRKLVHAFAINPESQRRAAVYRWGVAFLILWAISSTTIALMSLSTIYRMSEIVNEIKIKAEQSARLK